jgi:hypothetical protein
VQSLVELQLTVLEVEVAVFSQAEPVSV